MKIASYTDERRFRRDMVGILGRFELEQDASYPGTFTGRVEVQVDSGRRDYAQGHLPQSARLVGFPRQERDHEGKLRDCQKNAADAQSATLLKLMDGLDDLNAEPVQSLPALIDARCDATVLGVASATR